MINRTFYRKNEKISISEMKKILLEYSVFRKLSNTYNYNINYFGNAEENGKKEKISPVGSLPGDAGNVALNMFEVRRFVLSLSDSNEKLFLFYHYIHGASVEKTADLMGISRRSAFRLKKRSLEYAAARYPLYLKNSHNGIKS